MQGNITFHFDCDYGWNRPNRRLCRKAYCWKRRPDGMMYLVQIKGAPFEGYSPLDCTGLFRTFADVEPTPEGIEDLQTVTVSLVAGWNQAKMTLQVGHAGSVL
jgi:hypothetical protein